MTPGDMGRPDRRIRLLDDTIRMRRLELEQSRSGRVAFDDRGNAVWQWSDQSVEAAPSVSLSKIGVGELSVVDDAPTAASSINSTGIMKGYNPYQSGMLDTDKKERRVKRDLKALSQWIAMKKNVQSGED
jgi:hypothetical protein